MLRPSANEDAQPVTHDADSDPGSTQPGETIYTGELLHRRWLSSKAFEIGLSRPAGFEFSPGQTIRILHGGTTRHYTLINVPGDDVLGLCVRHIREGVLSSVLAEAEPGTRFRFTGPHGYFVFRPCGRPAVFAATGTGIAPFVAMARSGVSRFILVHGIRRPAELYYRELFSAISASYVPCISEAAAGDEPVENAFEGKVTGYIKNRLDRRAYDFYLCGRQEMIREVTLLADQDFPGSRVYTEVYF
jgi:benzoate/toluate 1,2-dioxygenase reductase component